jgi:release factor glutamine methyltransferase
MQIGAILKTYTAKLMQHSVPTPALDARLLLEYVANITHEDIYLRSELELDKASLISYEELIARRINREPVAKIIGVKSFWLSDFIVNNHTLDPRPDSEVIISAAISLFSDKNKKLKFLDLGTGSGCLILSLLQEFPNAQGVATDVSIQALKVADQNAKKLKLDSRVRLIQQNWGDGLDEEFDLIVSNPPYIPSADILMLETEVQKYEPNLALDGGADGLDPYRYLAKQINKLLKADSCAILEFGCNQAYAVKRIFRANGYIAEKTLLDLAGIERAAIFRSLEKA